MRVNDKVNGGAGSIVEQLVQTHPDVLLGGGKQYFDQTVKAGKYQGLTVAQQAKVNGYQIATDAAGLAAASKRGPILGAFAKNNMELEWVGPTPTRTNAAPAKCAVNAASNAAQPHLVDMTSKALDVLDYQTRDSRKDFFLQIEGASIDKQDHAANPCGQIGETVAFDAAIKKVLSYQKVAPGHPRGRDRRPRTHQSDRRDRGDGLHRDAAGGPQAANVLGVTNQTDLFFTMKRALGIS